MQPGLRHVSLLCVLLFVMLFVGCGKPSGDPQDILNKYYESVKNSNFDAAYDLVTEQDKKSMSKEDFILYQRLNNEIMGFKSFKIEKEQNVKNKELNGTLYDYATEFNVVEITEYYYDDNKEISETFKEVVVNEDNSWKVCKNWNVKTGIANNYTIIGWMYAEGKGKKWNLNEAAINFKNALKYDKEDWEAYYGLAYTYFGLGRYDESIEQVSRALNGAKDKEFQSKSYNILGLNYASKGDYTKAKETYNKALELDSNNEYARNNLLSLEF